MDEDRLPAEQECSVSDQDFSLPIITDVVSLAESTALSPDVEADRPETTENVTPLGAARQAEEEVDAIPLVGADRWPRVLKNASDRNYEKKYRVGSDVSGAMTGIKILVPINVNPASLNVLPVCFNQFPASADSLSQQPQVTILDTAQPSGYPSFVRIINPPSTESALPAIQAAQPSQLQSSTPPVTDSAHSRHVPATMKSLPTQSLITVVGTAAAQTADYTNFVHLGHPQSTEFAANMQLSNSSQQQSLCSPPPLNNSSCFSRVHSSTSSALKQSFAPQDATQPSGIPNVQMVPPSASKSVPSDGQSCRTNRLLGSVGQERVNNVRMSDSSAAHLSSGIANSTDACKLQAVKAANRLVRSSIIEPSVQSTTVVQTTNKGTTTQMIEQPTGNGVHKVNILKSKESSHLSKAPQNAEARSVQTVQRIKKYPTQVWMRNEPGTSSVFRQQCNAGPCNSRQRQEASSSDKSMHCEKQCRTCKHRRDTQQSSWDRIIVTSDISSKLKLDEIRRGIEAFLLSRESQHTVCKNRILRLHWDGKDLGTFRFKDDAPSITIEEEIIISSSDDELIEADKACPATSVTRATLDGVTHDPHVVGSQKSASRGIKNPLEPCVVLVECTSSDSEECSDKDDLSEGRKGAKSSDDDPTYSPDEEEISSEDKTSPDNSDVELSAKSFAARTADLSADCDSDVSSMQYSLPTPRMDNQNSSKPLEKGNKKHLMGCLFSVLEDLNEYLQGHSPAVQGMFKVVESPKRELYDLQSEEMFDELFAHVAKATEDGKEHPVEPP
ncbi:hypothetical protein HPB50_007331 [Hyalomma asiaticum]|uniref:Uncharacterized protein n=1 Tax=Hyalomma asiaticum TaxID=266040 RepID=A0ACB7TGG6_HYAAI|nr:hypothetical protein HPB50_007331 [Hyalomma asiaticum]